MALRIRHATGSRGIESHGAPRSGDPLRFETVPTSAGVIVISRSADSREGEFTLFETVSFGAPVSSRVDDCGYFETPQAAILFPNSQRI
jgi:hypothetical protein